LGCLLGLLFYIGYYKYSSNLDLLIANKDKSHLEIKYNFYKQVQSSKNVVILVCNYWTLIVWFIMFKLNGCLTAVNTIKILVLAMTV
jgi:hypothetical protein